MSLNRIRGDLLKLAHIGKFDVIVHGANCFCTMGSGIARQIREQFPDAYAADRYTQPGDYNKLGNYTQARCTNAAGRAVSVINAYTQYNYNRPGEHQDLFEYLSFALILQKLAREYPQAHFGFPLIGQGLAGGDAAVITKMLDDFAQRLNETSGTATLVEYETQ
jgi:O-acetyl-ADP-ribose deacetylase (regulator of RNase III)